MITNPNRVFRFTSSQMWKLATSGRGEFGFGAPALTYIEEKRAERYLGRSIDIGTDAEATTWGKVCEFFFNKFELKGDLTYENCGDLSVKHPVHDFWAGSPDFIAASKVGELKCFYPKAFFQLSQDILKADLKQITLAELKETQKEVYWQVVSNAILCDKPNAEIMAYTPTEAQLIEIRKECEESNIAELLNLNPWQTRFIYERPLYKLPYIPEGIEYPNFVRFEFEVPKADIEFLTDRIINANEILTR